MVYGIKRQILKGNLETTENRLRKHTMWCAVINNVQKDIQIRDFILKRLLKKIFI